MHEAGMLTAQPQHCIQSSWIMTVYIAGQQKLPSVTLLWTRCGHDTTSSCLFVLINSSVSLHHLIERYIDSCVASNMQYGYVRNQLQFVMCLAARSQELFSNHVIVMADNDVVHMLYFVSEINSSVSVIVKCLGTLASPWKAHYHRTVSAGRYLKQIDKSNSQGTGCFTILIRSVNANFIYNRKKNNENFND
jgi:hypothetical protein